MDLDVEAAITKARSQGGYLVSLVASLLVSQVFKTLEVYLMGLVKSVGTWNSETFKNFWLRLYVFNKGSKSMKFILCKSLVSIVPMLNLFNNYE